MLSDAQIHQVIFKKIWEDLKEEEKEGKFFFVQREKRQFLACTKPL